MALSAGALGWPDSADVRFVRGDLAGVGRYVVLETGVLQAATTNDYLVKYAACGSWQSTPGAEPARDASLP